MANSNYIDATLETTGEVSVSLTATNYSVGTSITEKIKGDKGDQGDKGDKGDKGDTGATGQNGKDGVSVSNAYCDKNNELFIVLTDGTIIDAGVLEASKGDKGDSATIAIGSVVSGTTASVVNSGTTTDAIFDFVLPKGDVGPEGPQGPKGDKGDCSIATFSVDMTTGLLIMTAPDDYSGPTFTIDENGFMEVSV